MLRRDPEESLDISINLSGPAISNYIALVLLDLLHLLLYWLRHLLHHRLTRILAIIRIILFWILAIIRIIHFF